MKELDITSRVNHKSDYLGEAWHRKDLIRAFHPI